jgi:uncharacterized protein YecE (DUF72 family)
LFSLIMMHASPGEGTGSVTPWIGTSGYTYPEWKGSFYPAALPAARMLQYYAERFRTVEINYTFYRMPGEKTLAGWAAAAPEGFRFSLKAPRRITHDAKLQRCDGLVRSFCDLAGTLGARLGVLLFQLPPSFRKDAAVLDQFVQMLPPRARAAFEFRHASWHDDGVFEILKRRNLALGIADTGRMTTPIVSTADYGYFRLRDEGYGPSDIARWADLIRARQAEWGDVYVYFKHEEQGKGPEFAQALMRHLPA